MLVSRTFKDDQRLQKCAVEHASHVEPNSAGPHVTLIQRALCALDLARIAPAEINARRYGSTTAGAVLAYKTKRNIINPQYQKVPDNIVGIMTIKSLDNEMSALELKSEFNQFKQSGKIF
jgi:peptidoglycan hydrolase-like protein with peptidoglycan-binding domain